MSDDEIEDFVLRHAQHFHFIDYSGISFEKKDGEYVASLPFKVVIPSRSREAGITKDGVKNVEVLTIFFGHDWLEKGPKIRFRKDFPTDFPHLSSDGELPYPCIYPGSNLRELINGPEGFYGLLIRVNDWLTKAARQGLYNYDRGWEPKQADDGNYGVWIDRDSVAKCLENESFISCTAVYRRVADGYPRSATIWDDSISKAKHASEGELSKTYCFIVKIPMLEHTVDRNFYSCSNLEELINLTKYYDNKKELSSQLRHTVKNEKDSFPADGLNILIVLAVKRPVHIEGSDHSFEFVFYWLRYRSSGSVPKYVQAKIAWPKDSVSSNFCQRLSGREIPDVIQKTTLIGVGSLGSKITSHLVRGGVKDLILIDDADFKSHNLIRHALSQIGTNISNKAELLKNFFKVAPAKIVSINESLEKVSNKEDLFKDRCIMDTTASFCVRETLLKNCFDSASVIACSSFKAYGEGGNICVEGEDRNPRLDDLWRYSHYQLSKLEDWNKFCEGRAKPEMIGQGCASLTMKISDIDASLMAALLTDIFVKAMQSNDRGFSAIANKNNDGSVNWEIDYRGPVTVVCSPKWEVRIDADVVIKMQEDLKKEAPVETGGPLFGEIDATHNRIYIFEAGDPPPDSKASKTEFIMGTSGIQDRAKFLLQRSCNHIQFLGSWHTHPQGGNHSSRDRQSLRKLRSENPMSMFLMIVAEPSGFHALTSDDLTL